MSIISKLTVSKTINNTINCSIIPVLLTKLKTQTLVNFISNYIPIPDIYIPLLTTIEENMKETHLGMASLTLEYNTTNSNTTINSIINTKPTKASTLKASKTTASKTTASKTKASTTKASTTKASKVYKSIHQLFIIPINDNSFNTNDDSELLELTRITGNAIFNRLKNNQLSKVNIIDTLDTLSNETKYSEALMEGLLLSSYRFLNYKTKESLTKTNDIFELKAIHLVLPFYKREVHKTSIINKLHKIVNQIKSVFLTRDLINEPANDGKGTFFIDIIKKYIKENKIPITLKIVDKSELEKLKMGLILGVGKGSTKENEPKMLILEYNGKHKNTKHSEHTKDNPEYVLLGKGITFDTGGINLKRSSSIYEMKTDMSGAAIVISFLLGYAMNNGSKTIYAMCPLVENSIGSGAIKPSDVLTAYGGKTVEITNTDAEGRLILADVLAYVSTTYPKSIIIDFATLTGQQESVSCKMFSNILSSNCENEVKTLIKNGKYINEPLVELPIMDKHLNKLESYVADIRNVSFSCSADIIMSSLFMKQFIKKNTKWIHIDIAGQSYKVNDIIKYASPEASGVGVRLLFTYFN